VVFVVPDAPVVLAAQAAFLLDLGEVGVQAFLVAFAVEAVDALLSLPFLFLDVAASGLRGEGGTALLCSLFSRNCSKRVERRERSSSSSSLLILLRRRRELRAYSMLVLLATRLCVFFSFSSCSSAWRRSSSSCFCLTLRVRI
jgi:hypothetical protein